MSMNLSLIMDVFLAVLLVIAIAYFWRLDGRLKALRAGRDIMMESTRELAQTIEQAEATIRGLNQSAEDVSRQLQARIDEARALSARAPGAGMTSSAADASSRGPTDAPQGGLRRRMNY